MCFRDARLFRRYVKKHVITEKRSTVNCINYVKKVQYVCQKSCEWKVYASQNKKTSKYHIKTLINKHTCMLEINFKWITDYYETELRMNPT